MALESVLGWLILLAVLAALSAALVLPLLHLLERAAGLRKLPHRLRLATVAAGGLALWFAIPFLVQQLYRWL